MNSQALNPARAISAAWHGTDTGTRLWLSAVGVIGVAFAWLSAVHPAHMPVWAPWEFSWPVFLAAGFSLGLFFTGLKFLPAAARPTLWRRIAFVVGVLSIYAVLQTRFDYMAQHMFFLHRTQHLVLHHLGPFLIALSGAGAPIEAALPAPVRRIVESRAVRGVYGFLQHPVVAPILFFGLIILWLIPSIHFVAMLDKRLYDTMNWSMAVDGILFWALVLDRRSKPPARISRGMRALLALAVVPPQILTGSIITLSNKDLYPVYKLCGRILPMTALNDQHYGGLIIWIPGAMMSLIAMLLVLNFLRLEEEARDAQRLTAKAATAQSAP